MISRHAGGHSFESVGRARIVLGVVVACLGAGCGGAEPNGPPAGTPVPVLTSIVVGLPAASLFVGQTETVIAAGRDQTNASISLGIITWSSSNASVASVNSGGVVTAISAGQATITAAADGKAGTATLVVVNSGTTTALTLATAGQSTAFLDSPDFQTSLSVQPGEQYLVAVVNTDRTPAQREDFSLVGGSGTSALTAPAVVARASATPDAPRPMDLHLARLERNRALFAERGSVRDAWARTGKTAAARASLAPAAQVIGAVNRVWVPRLSGTTCTDADSIGARTVAVGAHIIVLADTNTATWPASLRPDSAYYQAFANEYDQVTWPHLLANIGNPLGYDARLSGAGKVTMVITPLLNGNPSTNGSSVVAFVDLCDFYPFSRSGTNADLSNQTEVFYSWIPGSAGYSVAVWEKALRATAAHESKHLVAYTDRILNNSGSLEEIWLEEGLAQESSEIWERNFSQAVWKGHATFTQTVACELNFGSAAPCDIQDDKPYNLLAGHLPFFFEYLQTESTTRTEGLGVDTPSNYGAGWAFARWATDQYATTTEGAFIKSLVNEPSLVGLPNLTQHTGQSAATLLTYWNLANAIFQAPVATPADIRATYPSFDFAGIFSTGQSGTAFCGARGCRLFTSSGTPLYPVQPVAVTAGTFTQTVTGMRGTSAAYFLLTAAATPQVQALRLTSPAGGTLSTASGLRVAILRVR